MQDTKLENAVKYSIEKVKESAENMTDFQNRTIDYYDKNADSFVSGTISVDLSQTQDRFLNKLNTGGYILDFGCGSGRDTKYFLAQGYKVDAADGSGELCRLASEYTGIHVKQMLFQEFDACRKYDGIWACSSILHLPKEELRMVLKKMTDALKENGVIYTSFKHSEFEGERNGRYFTDFTIDTFTAFMQGLDSLEIKDYWLTSDARLGRSEEKWLNLILQKN